MKASNEELQSSNEKLRSTMEELETSKERIAEAMNESLRTLRPRKNRHRLDELKQFGLAGPAKLAHLDQCRDIVS